MVPFDTEGAMPDFGICLFVRVAASVSQSLFDSNLHTLLCALETLSEETPSWIARAENSRYTGDAHNVEA